jgi:hypothetical protein
VSSDVLTPEADPITAKSGEFFRSRPVDSPAVWLRQGFPERNANSCLLGTFRPPWWILLVEATREL